MKKETINKLCASYMEDARGVKRNMPNREFVLRLIEDAYKAGLKDAYKGIKPLNWTVGKYGMCWKVWNVGEYLHLEDRPEIVHQYKEFGFNINDVCLTPNVKIKWDNKTNYFEVITAQSDNGRWDYGLHYNFWTQGGCNGAAYVDTLKDGYNTEKEAINAALSSLEEKCQRVIDEIRFRGGDIDDNDSNESEIRGTSALPILKEAMRKIAYYKELFNPRQLELFDL